MTTFFGKTLGVVYVRDDAMLALIPSAIDNLRSEFVNDVSDFLDATDFQLDRAFRATSGTHGPGLLKFCLKHLGPLGHPHVPPSIPGVCGGATTAETAVHPVTPAFGVAGKGSRINDPNFHSLHRAANSVEWDGNLR